MQNNKITIIIIALLIILVVGYIYKDISSKQIIEDKTSTSTPEFTEGMPIEFEYVDDVSVDKEALKEHMPNLDRKIVFNVEMSQEQKIKFTNKINEIVGRLKKDSMSFDDWISLGANRKQIGDYEGVVEVWEYASLLSPLNTVPLNNLGNLYHYQLKDYQKAEENFKKATEIGPTYISPYTNLFDLYSLSYKQNTNNAEQILLKGLENIPNQINLLMTLANYYKEDGQNSKAVTYYEKTAVQAQKIGDTALYNIIQTELNNLK